MFWKPLLQALTFGLGGTALGATVAFIAGYVFRSSFGEDNVPLLWVVGGIAGLVLGLSQVSWKKKRRRRRHRPQVVLPPMQPPGKHSSQEKDTADHTLTVQGDSADSSLFCQATNATLEELRNVRVCDIRLDSDGRPLSIRLRQGQEEREVFLVHDHHCEIVARVLAEALRREPGNLRAKLFV